MNNFFGSIAFIISFSSTFGYAGLAMSKHNTIAIKKAGDAAETALFVLTSTQNDTDKISAFSNAQQSLITFNKTVGLKNCFHYSLKKMLNQKITPVDTLSPRDQAIVRVMFALEKTNDLKIMAWALLL